MSFGREMQDFASGFRTGFSLREGAKARQQQRELFNARQLGMTTGQAERFEKARPGFGAGAKTGVETPRAPAGGAGGGGAGPAAYKTGDPVDTTLPTEARAFLNVIAGPESAGKYNVRYTPKGGVTFDMNGQHPGIAEPGPAGPSTAAGRYQFTKSTWDSVTGGQVPFTPENQDKYAWQLAQRDYASRTSGRNLLTDLKTNNGPTIGILSALSPTWASFKGNITGSAQKTYADSMKRLSSPPTTEATAAPTTTAAAPGTDTSQPFPTAAEKKRLYEQGITTEQPPQEEAQQQEDQPPQDNSPNVNWQTGGTGEDVDYTQSPYQQPGYADGGAVQPGMRVFTQAPTPNPGGPTSAIPLPRQIDFAAAQQPMANPSAGIQQRFRDLMAARAASNATPPAPTQPGVPMFSGDPQAYLKAKGDYESQRYGAEQYANVFRSRDDVHSGYSNRVRPMDPYMDYQTWSSRQPGYQDWWQQNYGPGGTMTRPAAPAAPATQGFADGGAVDDQQPDQAIPLGQFVSPRDYGRMSPGGGPIRESTAALWRLDAQAQQRAKQRLVQRDHAYQTARPAAPSTTTTMTPTNPLPTKRQDSTKADTGDDYLDETKHPKGAPPAPPAVPEIPAQTGPPPGTPGGGPPPPAAPPPSVQGARPAYGPGMAPPAPNQPRDVYAQPAVPGPVRYAVRPLPPPPPGPAYGPGTVQPSPNAPRAPYAPSPLQPERYATPGSEPIPLPTVVPPSYDDQPPPSNLPPAVRYATPGEQIPLTIEPPNYGDQPPPPPPPPPTPSRGPGTVPVGANAPRGSYAPQAIPTGSGTAAALLRAPAPGPAYGPGTVAVPSNEPRAPYAAQPLEPGRTAARGGAKPVMDTSPEPWLPGNVPEAAKGTLSIAWQYGRSMANATGAERTQWEKRFNDQLVAAMKAGTPHSTIEAYADNFGVRAPPRPKGALKFQAGGAVPDDEEDYTPANQQAAAQEQPVIPPGGRNLQAATPEAEVTAKGGKPLISRQEIQESTKAGLKYINDNILSPRPQAALQDPAQSTAQQKFDTNDHALTAQEITQIGQQVDPENKLPQAQKILKAQQDMYDFYMSEGLPEKAAGAAASVLMYGRRVSQVSGNMALAALQSGRPDALQQAGAFMAKAYETMPNGQELRIDSQPGSDGKLGYQVVDQQGKVVDQGRAGADEMTTMAKSMASGQAWASETFRVAQETGEAYGGAGRGRRGYGPSYAQQTTEERRALSAAVSDAGAAFKADPSDENRQKYDAAKAAAATGGVSKGALDTFDTIYNPKAGKQTQKDRDTAAQQQALDDEKQRLSAAAAAEQDPRKKRTLQTQADDVDMNAAWDGALKKTPRDVPPVGPALDYAEDQITQAGVDRGTVEDLASTLLGPNRLGAEGAVKLALQALTAPESSFKRAGNQMQIGNGRAFYANTSLMASIFNARKKVKQPAPAG